MKGNYHIIVQNNKLHYELTIRRNITIIRGDSATGKTKLIDLLEKASDNYFVIVTREDLPNLPYSVDEIYGIRTSGKYHSLKRTYNELYHIYRQV